MHVALNIEDRKRTFKRSQKQQKWSQFSHTKHDHMLSLFINPTIYKHRLSMAVVLLVTLVRAVKD